MCFKHQHPQTGGVSCHTWALTAGTQEKGLPQCLRCGPGPQWAAPRLYMGPGSNTWEMSLVTRLGPLQRELIQKKMGPTIPTSIILGTTDTTVFTLFLSIVLHQKLNLLVNILSYNNCYMVPLLEKVLYPCLPVPLVGDMKGRAGRSLEPGPSWPPCQGGTPIVNFRIIPTGSDS